MIRPCDLCGGSGDPNPPCGDPVCEADHADSCGRCVDMPKLPRHYLPVTDPTIDDSGWFKPGPDTILRWCFVHDSPCYVPEHWQIAVCNQANFDRTQQDCDLGWVERPTRLEIVK